MANNTLMVIGNTSIRSRCAQAKNQYVWIGNQHKEVYYDGLGNMVYGQQKINGKWQYFDTVTGCAKRRTNMVWIANQNKEVYYDGLGNMVYGQQKINGKWQYFDTVTGAQVKKPNMSGLQIKTKKSIMMA